MAERRSRGGCADCRKRRRKCSEDRPRCTACVQRNVPCEYPVRLQWAVTEQGRPVRPSRARSSKTSLAAKASSRRRQDSTPPVPLKEPLPVTPDDGPGHAMFHVPPSPDGRGFIWNAACISPGEQSGGQMEDSRASESAHEDNNNNNNNDDDDDDEDDDDDGDGDGSDMEDGTITTGWDFNDSDFFGGLNPDLFGNAGERIAFTYWLNYLSGVLPALDSAANNPYRRLASLALASPVLLDTIVSLATEYMYCHGRAAPETVAARHEKAIGSLRTLLSASAADGRAAGEEGGRGEGEGRTDTADDEQALTPKQATLAAVLLQMANLVFIGGAGIDVHLACAMHFLQDLGYAGQRPVTGFVPRLLVQRFAFIDVTTALLRRRRPHLPADFWLFVPDEHYDRTVPSFREMTGCPQPLLGFFSRVAHLAVDMDAGVRDEHAVLRAASTLETDMRIYVRSRVTFRTTRPTVSRHLDSLGQCFYWSAQLLLQRHVYRDPAHSPRVQHTLHDLVTLIRSMPPGCGPDSALPFPFYLSSRDAVTQPHRDWVRQRNRELKLVYPGRTRDALMGLLEQIWAAVDEGQPARAALDHDADSVLRRLEKAHDVCLF